jgi:[acyl-carrier-protein] S-malonyltransferase
VSGPRLALLCPGQGAQKVGMGRALATACPAARRVFDEAGAILGPDFLRVVWEGPEDELKQTVNTQPALLAHSVAAIRVLEERGVRAAFAAGHSLGEYSAHVAAGSLTFADALRLVRRRGELMQAAGQARPGAMAALVGLAPAAAEALCRAARDAGAGEVVAANLNSPTQVVVSGEVGAVEAVMAQAKPAGARMVVRLEVSGAFHSPLMAPAAAGLAAALATVPVRDAAFPVVANATAEPVREAAAIRAALGAQLLAPVRWEESMRRLLAEGAGAFVEVGSGKVLRGLLKAVDKDAPAANVDEPASLEEALGLLAGLGVEVTA